MRSRSVRCARARSSLISKSLSFALMLAYKAVILTRLLCRSERLPSWLEKVFWRVTGSKEELVEVEARDAGWSMVATDMSAVLLRCDLERSFALEIRLGTSVRIEKLIYPSRVLAKRRCSE